MNKSGDTTNRKPGRATSHSIIMAAHNIGLLTTWGRKKHKQ